MADAPPETRDAPATAPAACRPADLVAALVVWGTLLSLLAAQLLYVARYGVDCFYYDEWVDSVKRLSGAEPVTASWLWSPHNEHRIPLPRLLFVSAYTLAGDDVRGAMYLNGLLLAAAAVLLLFHVRRLRGGRWAAPDVFLPLAVLGFGHYANILWGFQLQFTSCALLCGLLLTQLVEPPDAPFSVRRAALLGGTLLLLPLTGSNGAAFVPAAALWLLWRGLAALRAPSAATPEPRKTGRVAIAIALVALLFTAVYFVGIRRIYAERPSPAFAARQVLHLLSGAPGRGLVPAPDVAPPPPILAPVLLVPAAVLAALAEGLRQRRRTAPLWAAACAFVVGAALVLALDNAAPDGPARPLRESFALVLVPITVVAPALVLLVARLLRRSGDAVADRPALLGAAAFLVGAFGLMGGIALSRTGIGEYVGLAPRYTTLTALALVCFYVLSVRASDAAVSGRYLQWWLAGLALLCLPGNLRMADAKGQERRVLLQGFLASVGARTPLGALSSAYSPAVGNRPEALAFGLVDLRQTKTAPFDGVPDDPAADGVPLPPEAARLSGIRRTPDGLLEPAPGGGIMEWDVPAAGAGAPLLYLLRLRYTCPGQPDAPEGAPPAYQVAVLAPGEAEPPVWPASVTGATAAERLGPRGLQSSLLPLPVRSEGAGAFFPNRPAAVVRLTAAPGAPPFRLSEVTAFVVR